MNSIERRLRRILPGGRETRQRELTHRSGRAILIRHAEPEQAGADPGLSPAGVARAAELIHVLDDAGITKIVTSDLKRTQQTAAALAAHLGQTPVVVPAADIAAIVDEILPAGLVLVVGHTDTVPDVIDQLGAELKGRGADVSVRGPIDADLDDDRDGLPAIDSIVLVASADASYDAAAQRWLDDGTRLVRSAGRRGACGGTWRATPRPANRRLPVCARRQGREGHRQGSGIVAASGGLHSCGSLARVWPREFAGGRCCGFGRDICGRRLRGERGFRP